MTSTKTNLFAKIGILSAISAILMYIEFPLPFLPPFLKIDLSELPVLIGVFSLGPLSGIVIELIKNLIHLFSSTSGGVGELANFLIGVSLVVSAGIVYKYDKTKFGAFKALTVGIIFMAIMGMVLNYFILLPFYANIGFSTEKIVAICNKINPFIVDKKTLIFWGVLPFNLIKGIIVSIITLLTYKKISNLLH